MAALTANELTREGFTVSKTVVAGLPMPVWSLDLEIELQREVECSGDRRLGSRRTRGERRRVAGQVVGNGRRPAVG